VGAREYDPRTARWLQRDPIDAASGDPNLYRYCGNDPINAKDPSGRIAFIPVLVGGAAVGALSGTVISGMYDAYNYLLHGQPWQWRNIGRGALLGAIGGAVASPLIAWLAPVLPVGLSGGIIGGTVASVPANLAQQGFSCMMGWQHSIDPFQIGGAAGMGALCGGVVLRPGLFAKAPVRVTHWSQDGKVPPGPGRWIMVGGPSLRNYWLSGVRQKGYKFKSHATGEAPAGALFYPEGWEAIKGLFGQRLWK